jgi:glycosyltransferase involved in cell wall biosynthesis
MAAPLGAWRGLRALYRFRREVWYSLSGLRFDDLKSSVRREVAGVSGVAASLRGLQQIESEGVQAARWAVVSCLPPEQTGIATCSFYSWRTCNTRIDFFSPTTDVDWFLGLADLIEKESRAKVRLLDEKLLMKCLLKYDYVGVLFVLGNSNHHIYTARLLLQCQSIGIMDRVVVHIHDPCMLNYVQQVKMLSNPELRAYSSRLYGTELSISKSVEADRSALHWALARNGILGLRHFTALGIRNFVVNSRAAAQLVKQDLGSSDAAVYEAFHPVFLPIGTAVAAKQSAATTPGAITFGAFGVASDSKGMDMIIRAVLMLKRRGHDVKLVMAGYRMGHFARKHADEIRRLDAVIVESPSDVELAELMAGVDVAVQLRTRHLGESSGVVPQLLALGVTTIVSAIGSFREFGDAVVMVDAEITAEQLADVMLTSARSGPNRKAMGAYLNKNSIAAFQERMLSIFSEIENSGRQGRLPRATALHLAG